MGFIERTFGVKCKGCGKRKHPSHFHGCSRCGDPYCVVCTAGGSDSRICPSCRDGMEKVKSD